MRWGLYWFWWVAMMAPMWVWWGDSFACLLAPALLVADTIALVMVQVSLWVFDRVRSGPRPKTF